MALADTLLGGGTAHRVVPQVMGGSARVTVVSGGRKTQPDLDAALASVETRLRQLEARWSRFDAGSEISALNRADGTRMQVSPDTVALLRAMVSAWHLTDGIVDAALLREVVAAGYAHSVLDPAALTVIETDAPAHGGLVDIEIDHRGSTVRLPRGLALDPGGIGKGLAADLVVEDLKAAGIDGALVEVGGDVRAFGLSPTGQGWFIDVADPHHEGAAIARAGVEDGGVATSSVLKRRWIGRDGEVRHHLIGPEGRPAHHGIATSTAVVATAALAEVMAKLPLLVGEAEGLDLLDAWEVPALVVRHDGTVVSTRFWKEIAR